MTKEVILRISGLQQMSMTMEGTGTEPVYPEGPGETVEVITPALYYFKNGKHYILYDEWDEMLHESTKNKVKVGDNILEVIKSGLVSAHMIFETDRKNTFCYETPFGQLSLGTLARSITTDIEEDHIHIDMEYTLDVNYNPLADYTLTLDLSPAKSENFSL